jgi:hypothetical protein
MTAAGYRVTRWADDFVNPGLRQMEANPEFVAQE